MLFIPGFLISYITFPGVMMHELGHQIACYLSKVCVFNVKYFQFDAKVSGYVQHEKTDNPWKSLLITYGPFLFNTILGTFLVIPMSIMWTFFARRVLLPFWVKAVCYVLGYLGVSCLANAFPSSGDAKVLFTSVVKNKDVPLAIRIIIAPFVALIYLCSLAKFVWFDFVFALGVPQVIYSVISHNPPNFWTMW
ncbi:MAG: DUF3267 domain-containing protein [Lachnospiraceae bacterium]|nr:DUF3267 domain-containing protein [Lachnospiraceae bacterium]